MKKWLTILAAMLMAVIFSVPVYAAGSITTEGGPPDDEDEVTVVYDWETGQPVDSGGAPAAIGGPPPADIRKEMVGDVPYITRYYQMESELGLAEVPQGFDQDGYRFTRHDLLKQETSAAVDTREANMTETIPCESEDVAKLMETAEKELAYDEDGYTGTLAPDVASIRFEAGESTSYNYTLTETREYPGLPANDASYIDKTITKGGATLYLDDIQWEVTATSPTDGGLVPTVYKGIATYSGKATGSRPSGYTAFITYSGRVSKTTPGVVTYAVVYRGTPIPVVADLPVVKTESGPSFWVYGGICIVVVGAVAVFLYLRRRKPGRCTDGLYGDLWEGRDEDAYTPEPAAYPFPDEAEPPASIFDAEPGLPAEPEPGPEDRKPTTAADILAAIEGIDDAPSRARRRAAARKEQIPLVEKLED